MLRRILVAYREHGELIKQMEGSASEEERGALQREQERLLVRMESKEEQISKLCKHKLQVGLRNNYHFASIV